MRPHGDARSRPSSGPAWWLIKTIARQDPGIICLPMARGELSRRYDRAVSDRN